LKSLLIILVVLISCAGEVHAGNTIAGFVRAVYDGDTVLLATASNNRLKVRLYGVDAPETRKPDKPGQPFGDVARRTLMYKIMGRQVSAEIVDTDQYDRSVAVLRYEGRDINREMVSEGLAWAYREYLGGAYASDYIGAEERARRMRKGLWRDNNPLPPWEFRHALSGNKKHGRKK
jgi:Micrococcal nuclease (thermonuclease) homologs